MKLVLVLVIALGFACGGKKPASSTTPQSTVEGAGGSTYGGNAYGGKGYGGSKYGGAQ